MKHPNYNADRATTLKLYFKHRFAFEGSKSAVLPTKVSNTVVLCLRNNVPVSVNDSHTSTGLYLWKNYNENFKCYFSILCAPEKKMNLTALLESIGFELNQSFNMESLMGFLVTVSNQSIL